jgi:hypothetical protein
MNANSRHDSQKNPFFLENFVDGKEKTWYNKYTEKVGKERNREKKFGNLRARSVLLEKMFLLRFLLFSEPYGSANAGVHG